MASEFISEDDLDTFEGFLRYQAVDSATATADEMAEWRSIYDEANKSSSARGKVGRMKLKCLPGEYRYAVAVHKGSDLWLTLWVKRNRKGEFFVMIPRADRGWDPHTSYHLDGTFHMKSHGHKGLFDLPKRQPLTGTFRGTEHLGTYGGHGPKGVGAVCDPADFAGVMEIPSGILGPRDGFVAVDLVEPHHDPMSLTQIIREQAFTDIVPWVVIRVCSSG